MGSGPQCQLWQARGGQAESGWAPLRGVTGSRGSFFLHNIPEPNRHEGWEVNLWRGGWAVRAEGERGGGRDAVSVEIQQRES